jgi:hypothetical protein
MVVADAEHFFATMSVSGECWEWQGRIDKEGYGCVRFQRQSYSAHRLAYQFANGAPPPDGMLVCHTCDNRRCINPSHLFVGTWTDNARDMSRKGRTFNQRKSACPSGHGYTTSNTYRRPNGSRVCRACKAEYMSRRSKRRRSSTRARSTSNN